MTIAPSAESPDHVEPRGFVWDRPLRSVLDAVSYADDDTPRALVVGNAGSGKTALLRDVRRFLTEHDRAVADLSGDVDVASVPLTHVLLVDDVHLLTREHVQQLTTRLEDPEATLVAACRPWPSSSALDELARVIERSRPAIVLGQVSRSDVLAWVEVREEHISTDCLDHLLTTTGGTAWLVSEALRAHDERDCAADPQHRELGRLLAAQIAYRLDRLDAPVRRMVQAVCLGGPSDVDASSDGDDLIARAYAEGLLLHGGRAVPLVQAAVRDSIPVRTLIGLSTGISGGLAAAAMADDSRDWITQVRDPEVGDALRREGDRRLDADPVRAAELYRLSLECGVESDDIAGSRALAAFGAGDIDEAAHLYDSARRTSEDRGLADVGAAVWAARGMMTQAAAAYTGLSKPDAHAGSAVRAGLVAFATGARDAFDRAPRGIDSEKPTTLHVAMRLLDAGLCRSLAGDARGALVDLVRAAEMYTASGTWSPTPELPAVIAVVAAIGAGDLTTAQTVIDDAVAGGHGGSWAQPRLALWQAWVCVQRAHPLEARAALARAVGGRQPLSPRDELLAEAVRVALARRYDDLAGLAAAWRPVAAALVRVDIDLFLVPPLTELVCSAAKLGEDDLVRASFERALEVTSNLGSPSQWSSHLSWSGIQRGILLGKPELLTPHAHALVAAGGASPVASTMARAGRVWTAVLAGNVDADAVESAARELAGIGLGWDGARLAGHGAGRTDDRRIAARLLACARELHPTDAARRPAPPATDADVSPASDSLFSERELEVARLVVEGKTYVEIGAAIFISPRTAEHHIAHIRRRLGASSRSDMIAQLRTMLAAGDPRVVGDPLDRSP